MNFNDMRLSTRIYIQQIILLVALIFISGYALYTVSGITTEMEIIRDDDLPVMSSLTLITEHQLEQLYVFEKMIRFGSLMEDDEEAQKGFKAAEDEFRTLENKLHQEIVDAENLVKGLLKNDHLDDHTKIFLSGVLEHMIRIRQENEDYAKHAEEIMREIEAGHVKDIHDQLVQIEIDQRALAKDIEEFLLEVEQEVVNKLSESTAHAENLTTMLIALTVISGLVGLALTIFTGFTLGVLKKSIENIGGSVLQVATAADQSSNAISTVADGARQQTEAIGQAVTAVDQSVGVITEVSTTAEESTAIAKESANMVENGIDQMKEMIAVVNRISDNSNEISKITEIISNIASQTNMLSLNAAIEAARAGEHGKGFAVVAEQVRKLAENSKNSVQDILELITQANIDSEAAVNVAGKVNEEMSKISQSSQETEKMMQNIATSMEQQVATVEELQHNMDTLKEIGNNNASASEEITETIVELSRIANETNNEVSKFNL